MNDIMKALADQELIQGEEALTLFEMLNEEGWRFGVKLARLYLERGEIEKAKAVLDALVEE